MSDVVWQGRSFNPGFALADMLIGAVLIATIREGEPGRTTGLIVLFAFVLIATLLYTWARCELSPTGLRIAVGPGGILPIKTIPISEIESVEAIDVSPLRNYGGWGFRYGGPPAYERGWAVVVKAGEAISIRRRDKKPFVVTIDGAGAAVAAYRSLIV